MGSPSTTLMQAIQKEGRRGRKTPPVPLGYEIDAPDTPGFGAPEMPPGYRVDPGGGDSGAAPIQQRGASGYEVDISPEAVPNPILRAIANFNRTIWGATTPSEATGALRKGLPELIRHPIESGKLMLEAAAEAHRGEWARAKEGFGRAGREFIGGRPWEATKQLGEGIGRTITTGVPVLGPMVGQAATQMEQGDIAGGVGTTAGAGAILAAPKAGPAGARLIERAGAAARTPMAGRLTRVPKSPFPAERISRAQVAEAAAAHEIPLTAADVSGQPALGGAQWMGEKALLGRGKIEAARTASRAGQIKWAEEFGGRMDPHGRGATTSAVGKDIKAGLDVALDVGRENARNSFRETLGPHTKGVEVDVSRIQSDFAATSERMAGVLEKLPEEYAGPVRSVIEGGKGIGKARQEIVVGGQKVNLGDLPPNVAERFRESLGIKETGAVTWEEAQSLRSAYWDMGHGMEQIPDSAQSFARQIVEKLDNSMENAAKEGGFLEEWRAANAEWKRLKEVYDNTKSPIRKAMVEPDPSKVVDSLLAKGERGASPHVVEMMKETGKDLGPLKREVMRRIQTGEWSVSKGKLGGFSDEFLASLYSTVELQEMYTMAKLGRILKKEPEGLIGKLSTIVQISAATGAALGFPMAGASTLAGYTLAARVSASKRLARIASAHKRPAQIPEATIKAGRLLEKTRRKR